MHEIENPEVYAIFDRYPSEIKEKLMDLRALILETANEIGEIGPVQETLKWGEPSYTSKYGSTVRIDWKEKAPDQYSMYFHCKTKLVDTFKEIYGDVFKFEGNRAIIFQVSDIVPEAELKHCIALSLNYHRVKNLPLLGA